MIRGAELTEKRTYNQKHFATDRNGTFVMEAHAGHIHYKKYGRMEEIDNHLIEVENGWKMDKASYHAFLPKYADEWFEFRNVYKEETDFTTRFRPVVNHVEGVLTRYGGHKDCEITYFDVLPDIDMMVQTGKNSLRREFRINKNIGTDLEIPIEIETDKDIDYIPYKLSTTKEKKCDKIRNDVKAKQYEEQKLAEKGIHPDHATRKALRDYQERKIKELDDERKKRWNKKTSVETTLRLKFIDGNHFTQIHRPHIWDSEGKQEKIKFRLENKNGIMRFIKIVPKSFLDKAIYPVFTDDSATYYSGAGDGYVLTVNNANWNASHDADPGYAAWYTKELSWAGVRINYGWQLCRAFLPIDTSGLPDAATISAATLNVTVFDSINGEADAQSYLNIVQTSQASNTELVVDDFPHCGSVNNPTLGATNINYGTTGLNTFTLNATGRGWISKTGYTLLGIRDGHDIEDLAPDTTEGDDGWFFRSSEYTGTGSDPYLSVTYSTATNLSVADNGLGADSVLRGKNFTISDNGIGLELISTNKTFIITDSGNGVDGILKGLSLTITDYGIGIDSIDRVIATDIDIQEWGVGVDEAEATIGAEEREHRKNYHIMVYGPNGNLIKAWKDANFIGFRKYINGGLGDCTLSLARKFDDYGEYQDVKLNNEIRISITDEDTINSNDSEKLIYTGYISKYEPFIDGGKEGVVVTCLGYYTKFAQDIYKNGTTTTITESATDVGTIFRNLMDRFRAETSNPKLFYTGGSIELTSTTASYTFEMMTYREAIDIIKRLAPVNWWWYVDQNNLVSFKSKPTTTTHTFIFGRHFKSVHIEKGMEKIKNAVLFWNQIAGVGQVYRLYKDSASVNDFGRRITKYFDPGRIGNTLDATKIADGLIDEHKDPDIKVKVEIIDNNYSTKGYDIESIEPGDTCSFIGFSDSLNETFKEGMIITEVEYHLDRVMLTIEPLQASIVDRIEEVARGLSSLNSKDAPSSYNE